MTRRRIGLFGGTFDPIHIGHLALARTALAALALDQVRFLPSGTSWQKSSVRASPRQRLEMVELALAGEPRLCVDPRETLREGATYTVDSLRELRAELGDEVALVLLLGSDQLHNLHTWHRWRELIELAHLGCTQRERVPLTGLPAEVEALLQSHGRQTLPDAPAGAIVLFSMPPVPVSSTAIRAQLARGERPDELVPPSVLAYIESRQLYRRPGAR